MYPRRILGSALKELSATVATTRPKTRKTAVLTFRPRSPTMDPMLGEGKKQFSFTRAAHSTMSGEKAISDQ